jgi:hypothetical protein
MKITTTAFLLLFVIGYGTSFAKESAGLKDECKPNLIGFDVCQKVREVADNMAPQLPMRMSSEILIDKVIALQKMLILTAILSYDESYLKAEVQKGGITMEDLLNNLKKATAKIVCQPKSATAALIRLGAQIQYRYYFHDMTPYAVVDIDRASCQSKK